MYLIMAFSKARYLSLFMLQCVRFAPVNAKSWCIFPSRNRRDCDVVVLLAPRSIPDTHKQRPGVAYFVFIIFVCAYSMLYVVVWCVGIICNAFQSDVGYKTLISTFAIGGRYKARRRAV